MSVISGEENPTKHEASYEHWIFEMRPIQLTYADPQIKEAKLKSVKGAAASGVHSLGASADVSKILE